MVRYPCRLRVYLFLGSSILKNKPIKELISPEVAGSVWKQVIAIADKYYQPGKFTTFVAYEWTSTPQNRKRRLAQKMEFLAEDVSALREPQINELKDWFEQNSQRFALPGRIWFHHVYFSFDRKGEKAREAAARAYKELAREAVDSPVAIRVADPFMFQDYYADCSEDQVAKTFGSKFAKALFQLPCGSWQGPVESGLGWHLVWVDSMTPVRVPAFEEVEQAVKTEWLAEQSAESKRRAFAIMKARYEIVLPDAVAKDSATVMVKKGTP